MEYSRTDRQGMKIFQHSNGTDTVPMFRVLVVPSQFWFYQANSNAVEDWGQCPSLDRGETFTSYASVCPRTSHWTLQCHLHIRRHELGKCGRMYLSLNISAGYSSITVCVERINNRRTMQWFLSCCELRTIASRATFIFWRQYSETFLLQIGAADI
jgi:hypothetical protein